MATLKVNIKNAGSQAELNEVGRRYIKQNLSQLDALEGHNTTEEDGVFTPHPYTFADVDGFSTVKIASAVDHLGQDTFRSDAREFAVTEAEVEAQRDVVDPVRGAPDKVDVGV